MPEYLSIATHERIEMISIGSLLAELLRKKADAGWKDGFLAVYSPHTTCGLTINEGWDPDVKADMERFLADRVPQDWGFRHAEGNSDAHIKTSIFGSSVLVPVAGGLPDLGGVQSPDPAGLKGNLSRTSGSASGPVWRDVSVIRPEKKKAGLP